MTDPLSLLVLAFVLALIVIAVASLVAWRTLRSTQHKAADVLELAEKEAALLQREMRNQTKVDLEQYRAGVEKKLSLREISLQETERHLDARRQKIEVEEKKLTKLRADISDRLSNLTIQQDEYRKKLESLSDLSPEQIRAALKDEIAVECSDEIKDMKREILGEGEQKLRESAQRVLVDTMQRFASTLPSEVAATLVKLPNEEMKGRIIGREGRNIHAFEAASGTTLMIDETPESVLVSSFDPVRREIARIALEALINDGRIHPASIEQAIQEAEGEMKQNVINLGEGALTRLRLRNVHPEIVELIGGLHFRLSNNQRTLAHAIEVANFCSVMASEIGLNPVLAKRAGLFHDLGKAIPAEYEGSHAHAAAEILRQHGEHPLVINAVEASHDEVAAESIYAALVQVADSLSSTRPGARSESMDGYIQRVKNLEDLARSFDGVTDAYALKAGRELRVVVTPERMEDADAAALARKIRVKIEEQLQYPGSIKVTVIRERRFNETAK